MKRYKPGHVAAAVYCIGCILIILSLFVAGFTLRGLLLVLIVIVLTFPTGFRAHKGKLDLFEPLVLSNIALGVMFIGRPLADLITGETIFKGYNVLNTFNEALFVALVGIVFFQIGYFIPIGYKLALRLPSPPIFHRKNSLLSGFFYVLIGGFLFSLFLKSSGGFSVIWHLMKGRQLSDNAIFLSSTGYFFNGLLMWGASSLIFFALAIITRRRVYLFFFIIPTLTLLVFYGARGSRSMILPLVLALPTFWYLSQDCRPSFKTIALTVLIGLSLLGWMREVRVAGDNRNFKDRLIQALSSPISETAEIISGADAEMFDALASALTVVPEQLAFQPCATITDILIRGVPRTLWTNKPLESNDALVKTLWPTHYRWSRAAPAFSVIGPFYADSGVLTVAIGMILISSIFSMTWQWLQRYKTFPIAQIVYSMWLPFVIILLRGTVPDTISRMLFLVIPLTFPIIITRFNLMIFKNNYPDTTAPIKRNKV